MPPTWTYECDEDLVHFLYDHIGKEDENLGSVKQYVDSIDVSSYTVSRTGGIKGEGWASLAMPWDWGVWVVLGVMLWAGLCLRMWERNLVSGGSVMQCIV